MIHTQPILIPPTLPVHGVPLFWIHHWCCLSNGLDPGATPVGIGNVPKRKFPKKEIPKMIISEKGNFPKGKFLEHDLPCPKKENFWKWFFSKKGKYSEMLFSKKGNLQKWFFSRGSFFSESDFCPKKEMSWEVTWVYKIKH